MKNKAILERMLAFKTMLKNDYAWPGGYPLYLITDDGACLCMDCARKEKRLIYDAIRSECNNGWLVVAQDVNYEDLSLCCGHCNDNIETAYAEDQRNEGEV